MSSSAPPPEPLEHLSYAEAVAELEAILKRIETADIDVDTLSTAVERAAELLKLCRARIEKAETRVVQVLSDIESAGGGGGGG
jgi:exodeoxyribonuclease VII small subunit